MAGPDPSLAITGDGVDVVVAETVGDGVLLPLLIFGLGCGVGFWFLSKRLHA